MLNRNEAAKWDMRCNTELHSSDGYATGRQGSSQLKVSPISCTCNYSLTYMKVTYHRMHCKTFFTKTEILISGTKGPSFKAKSQYTNHAIIQLYASQQFGIVFCNSLQLVHIFTLHFLKKIHSNTVLTFMPLSSKWSPSTDCPTQILYAFQMSCPTHLILLHQQYLRIRTN
jgi:hypothetical protein